jgi:hypothetical protein
MITYNMIQQKIVRVDPIEMMLEAQMTVQNNRSPRKDVLRRKE